MANSRCSIHLQQLLGGGVISAYLFYNIKLKVPCRVTICNSGQGFCFLYIWVEDALQQMILFSALQIGPNEAFGLGDRF